ncbi:hypothetical protein SDC9_142343 [bioreactor metagenome]|uniref:Uncharacterized protein n=1 Tax=bioreactor metagenome TaxID=1076179 RepID=A0A645E087_9ZZZZ
MDRRSSQFLDTGDKSVEAVSAVDRVELAIMFAELDPRIPHEGDDVDVVVV